MFWPAAAKMNLTFFTLLALIISLTSGSTSIGRLSSIGQRQSHNTFGIINGKTASIKKFPFLASFSINGTLIGSGVILNKHWVLTTGFNAAWDPVDTFTLRVGSNRHDRGGQLLRVSKVAYPSQYTGSWDYDVAVVKVTKPIKFGKKVKAARLATKTLKSKAKAVVAGWGITSSQGSTPSTTLRSTVVTTISWKSCEATYQTDLTKRLMCTSDSKTGPCIYDFSDPLIYKNTVYGLFAGGYGCLTYPALYTDIPSLLKWIKSAIKS